MEVNETQSECTIKDEEEKINEEEINKNLLKIISSICFIKIENKSIGFLIKLNKDLFCLILNTN